GGAGDGVHGGAALSALRCHVCRLGPRASSIIRPRAYPNYSQILAICSVVCRVKRAQEFGCGSAKQLAMYISKLGSSPTMRLFYQWHSGSYLGEPTRLDNVFKFLRAAEYSLPELFAVVELFVQRAKIHANYALFLAELPRWFRADALKILEEQ